MDFQGLQSHPRHDGFGGAIRAVRGGGKPERYERVHSDFGSGLASSEGRADLAATGKNNHHQTCNTNHGHALLNVTTIRVAITKVLNL